MKKSKLSLCMISCLLAVGSLAGCEKKIKSRSDGVLLTYSVDGGAEVELKADDLLDDYYDDSTKYQSIYDTIYSVIVRNYFAKERTPGVAYEGAEPVELGLKQMDQIKIDAKEKVENDKDTARENADTNNTKYKKELEAILKSKGVESEDELFQKYVEELQKETFEDNFYKYSINELKRGSSEGGTISVPVNVEGVSNFKWDGYINDQLPYHVSHVMVALSDSSDTNFSNGTISEENAKKLYNVVNLLGDPSKSFSYVALNKSDDTSSGEQQGDLGIMDYSTSFINEFKLGVYAYEQLYAGTFADATKIPAQIKLSASYTEEVEKTFGAGLPTVNYSVFEELNQYAKDEKANGNSVMEGSTSVFPRNIIYNQYLNIHSVFFIEKDAEAAYSNSATYALGDKVTKDGVIYECTTAVETPEEFDASKWVNTKYIKFNDKYVLHAEIGSGSGVYKPVIAVRGSSQDKQEIHFIVVNRSPFEDDTESTPDAYAKRSVNGVSLENYYSTFYPRQAGYPKKDGKAMKTYVNFLNSEESDNKKRAEDVASKLKSFDSDKIGKYIFLKYMNEEKITFGGNQKLAKALMKWINTSVEKSQEEKGEKWEKTVNEYVEKLKKQNSERTKLIPEVGKFMFKYANEDKTASQCFIADGKAITDIYKGTKTYHDVLVDAVKTLGKSQAEAEDYVDNVNVSDWYNVKGGLFNDGKTHVK